MSGDTPQYTRADLMRALGVSVEAGERLWKAFGFPYRSTDDILFTDADLDALRMFADSSSPMPIDAQVATARALGQTMSRLADWEADQLTALDRDPDVRWTMPEMVKALEQIQRLVWRQHLGYALQRDEERESDERLDLIVGFADIVGYTSLSRRINLDDLEWLLESFEERTFGVVDATGGQVIKTIGDAVMFTYADPVAAADGALAIHRLSLDDPIPPLRVGLARGEVLSRRGDIFGEPVNIAARLCGSARPGTILVDEAVASELSETPHLRVKSIPSLSVRGYRRLKAKTVELNKHHAKDLGPVHSDITN